MLVYLTKFFVSEPDQSPAQLTPGLCPGGTAAGGVALVIQRRGLECVQPHSYSPIRFQGVYRDKVTFLYLL